MTDCMDPQVVSDRIESAIANNASFIIRYWESSGTRTVYGQRMTAPLPHAIAFYEWEAIPAEHLNGAFLHSGLIVDNLVEAIWTENDDCPNCEERIVDLDTWDTGGSEPWCFVCEQEARETQHADLLTSDGGLI